VILQHSKNESSPKKIKEIPMKSCYAWTRPATVLAALCMLAGCGGQKEEAVPIVRPVITMLTPETGVSRPRTFSGTAKASVESVLSFRVPGEITALPVKLGQSVRESEMIAQLDHTDYELQEKQAEAQVAEAEAYLEQARNEFERMRQLYEANNISKSTLDNQQAMFKSALAQREAASKGLELARQQLEYCTLRSPVDGVIASIPVELHQTVQAGATVATLSAGEKIEVEFGVPEVLIADITVGLPAEVRFEAVPGEVFAGRVSEVGVDLTASSTYPVRLELQDSDSRIRPGMIAEAVLTFRPADTDAIYVPPVAVIGEPGGKRHVWIFNEGNGVVEKRGVKVGALTTDGLQIVEGLQPGEHLVIRGVHQLHEGMRVRLMND
jgi:RND family efflux transporter MFP subunit